MDWFAEWFNTSYYHILYKDRDYKEAQYFINQLVNYLKLPKDAKIQDLACGKGRHSIYLHSLGFQVTGIDLAKNSIEEAKKNNQRGLNFVLGDMREIYKPNEFDAVFNLFTSFGYFNTEEDNQKVYNSVFAQLKSKGIFVLDFMNAEWVAQHLILSEQKVVDGISFDIKRKVEKEFIVKDIRFKDQSQNFYYQERVKIYSLQDFTEFSQNAGFQLKMVFGDYDLNFFDPKKSPRLILILQK